MVVLEKITLVFTVLFEKFFISIFQKRRSHFPPNQLEPIDPKKLADAFAAGDFDLLRDDDDVEEERDGVC
jgi:hypothetical protein